MRSSRLLNGAVIALVALGAACSDSDQPPAAAAEPTTTTTVAPRNVVEAAAYDTGLSTMATALNLGGMVDALTAKGPFTVFAPTNDAFSEIPNDELQELLTPRSKALSAALARHVVRGRLLESDLEAGEVETLRGEKIALVKGDDGFTIRDANGNTARIAPDPVVATNGVVYRIDAVLAPRA